VGRPLACLHEFLAIVTHPRIYDPPTPVDQALTQVEAWLDAPTLVLLAESPDHWPQLRSLVAAGATGARVHDARIAALCAGSGVTELWTADRDFSRFPVRTVNPLLA
jgi:predicted nucleic acid-binding protein